MAESNNGNNERQMDYVRVLRTIEYTGGEEWIRNTLARSIPVGRPLYFGGNAAIKCLQLTATERRLEEVPSVRPPLVYIAGPFGATTLIQHHINVANAGEYRAPLAKLGCYPVCPHTNTSGLGGDTGTSVDPEVQKFWYDGSIELLRRCDAILMIANWQSSKGAQMEKQMAEAWGLPVLYAYAPTEMAQVAEWLGGRKDW